MDLYLVRHADAADGDRYREDAERPLTAEGRRQAQRVGEALLRQRVVPELIVSSPFVRAVQTAERIAVAVGYERMIEVAGALEPGVGAKELFDRAVQGSATSVMLVGHEPSMGNLLSALTGASAIAMKKAQVVRLELLSGATSARFCWVIGPSRLEPATTIAAV
jgi:phosphohistidine phosphatase